MNPIARMNHQINSLQYDPKSTVVNPKAISQSAPELQTESSSYESERDADAVDEGSEMDVDGGAEYDGEEAGSADINMADTPSRFASVDLAFEGLFRVVTLPSTDPYVKRPNGDYVDRQGLKDQYHILKTKAAWFTIEASNVLQRLRDVGAKGLSPAEFTLLRKAEERRIQNDRRVKAWKLGRKKAMAQIMDLHGINKEDKLGQGGFGRVYRAQLTTKTIKTFIKAGEKPPGAVGHVYAVKIGTSYLNAPEKDIYRYLEQFDRCPNVATFFDFGNHDQSYFTSICLKMAPGSLSNLIHKASEAIQEADMWTLLFDITNALMFLHTGTFKNQPLDRRPRSWKPMIHRDIKAGNILFYKNESGDYQFVLTDFGCVEFWPTEANTPGTPEFLAPEWPQALSPAFDMWCLGCVMHETITEELPRYRAHCLNDYDVLPKDFRKKLHGYERYQAISQQPVVCMELSEPPEGWVSNERWLFEFKGPRYRSVSVALHSMVQHLLIDVAIRDGLSAFIKPYKAHAEYLKWFKSTADSEDIRRYPSLFKRCADAHLPREEQDRALAFIFNCSDRSFMQIEERQKAIASVKLRASQK